MHHLSVAFWSFKFFFFFFRPLSHWKGPTRAVPDTQRLALILSGTSLAVNMFPMCFIVGKWDQAIHVLLLDFLLFAHWGGYLNSRILARDTIVYIVYRYWIKHQRRAIDVLVRGTSYLQQSRIALAEQSSRGRFSINKCAWGVMPKIFVKITHGLNNQANSIPTQNRVAKELFVTISRGIPRLMNASIFKTPFNISFPQGWSLLFWS